MTVWEDILAQVDNYRLVIEQHAKSGKAAFESARELG